MSLALASRRAAISPAWVKNPLWRTARAVPSLDLPFADTKSLVDAVTGQSLVTFTRASSGTCVGSDGLLRTAAVNEPRFDHNPTTGESLGLLVEEQRTNLVLRSEEFGTTWITTRASVSSDATTAPNGATTADKLVEDTTATNTHSINQGSILFASGLVYTFSCYVKQSGRQNVRLAFPSAAFTTSINAQFNLANGTVVATSAGVTSSMQAVGNDWYRCVVTATATATASSGPTIFIGETATSANISYTGDGTSGIYLWGAQLEAGAFPTSYIPTTTATATRSADVASNTGTAFSSWYRQDEGTVFADAVPRTFANLAVLASFDDNSTANRVAVRLTTAANANLRCAVSSVAQADFVTANAATANTVAKIAAGYAISNFGVSLNGVTAIAQLTGSVPSVVNQLTIGSAVSGFAANSTIRRLTYWPQRLPNSTIQAITQ